MNKAIIAMANTDVSMHTKIHSTVFLSSITRTGGTAFDSKHIIRMPMVNSVSLASIEITNSFFNVTSHSNIVAIDIGGTVMSAQVPPGHYDSIELGAAVASAIQNILTTLAPAETATVSTDTVNQVYAFDISNTQWSLVYNTDSNATTTTISPRLLGLPSREINYVSDASGTLTSEIRIKSLPFSHLILSLSEHGDAWSSLTSSVHTSLTGNTMIPVSDTDTTIGRIQYRPTVPQPVICFTGLSKLDSITVTLKDPLTNRSLEGVGEVDLVLYAMTPQRPRDIHNSFATNILGQI